MKKRQFYQILFIVSFWVFAAFFIVTYEAAQIDFKSPSDDENYNFSIILLVSVLVTFIAGNGMAIFEVLFFSKLLRKRSFGGMLAIKTLFYLSCMFTFISLAVIIIESMTTGKSLFDGAVISVYISYITSIKFIMTMAYWGLANLFVLFILQVSEKFGQGVLLNFLLGKYHQPKEEQRIFMFMDLKSSTTIAEKLGHIKYSNLIQDCFYDLTDVVVAHDAKIYQYVGDEVVLSWDIKQGIDQSNCLKTFFSYDELLQSKKSYYQNKYGVVPEFKAGLNSGPVTAAEVGEIKKELAYHGDVLNTAARIQDQCNQYQQKLLASEKLKNNFNGQTDYSFEFLGDILLKGKEESVNIYAINTV